MEKNSLIASNSLRHMKNRRNEGNRPKRKEPHAQNRWEGACLSGGRRKSHAPSDRGVGGPKSRG